LQHQHPAFAVTDRLRLLGVVIHLFAPRACALNFEDLIRYIRFSGLIALNGGQPTRASPTATNGAKA
jgi:hypothetical protein